MPGGYIKLWRQIQDNRYWHSERFTKGQAWVDLLMLAAHADHQVIRDYQDMPVLRGQILTSQLALARRWLWHRESVIKLLRLLKTDSMIDYQTSTQTHTGYTLITICNYEKYQGSQNGDYYGGTDTQTDTQATAKRQSSGTIKKGKKGKEELPVGFAGFWSLYPRRAAKAAAVRVWMKLSPGEDLRAKIMEALAVQVRQDYSRREPDKVPHAATWLNGRRWEDELPAVTAAGPQYPKL